MTNEMDVESPGKSGLKESTFLSKCVHCVKLIAQVVYAVLATVGIVIKFLFHLVIQPKGKSLRGSTVLITGAGGGIGRELSLQFAQQGCKIICVDLDEENNNKTADLVNSTMSSSNKLDSAIPGNKIQFAWSYKCNVSDLSDVQNLAKEVYSVHDKIDILVNNAGIMPVQPFLETDYKGVMDVVNVNLLAHFWTLMVFLPDMMKRNSGHIVGVSSVAGLAGLAIKIPYSATKFGVVGLMDALSEELHLQGSKIKTTTICPYFTQTRTDIPEILDLSLPILTPNFVAGEVIKGVRRDSKIITIPRSLLFWLNFFRILPQDARRIWRDLFYAKVIPTEQPTMKNTI